MINCRMCICLYIICCEQVYAGRSFMYVGSSSVGHVSTCIVDSYTYDDDDDGDVQFDWQLVEV